MRTGLEMRRERGKGPAWVLAALGCLLVLAALALSMLDGGAGTPLHRSQPRDHGHASGRSAAAAVAADRHRGTAGARGAVPHAGRPVRLTIPGLGVSAPVTPVDLEGAALVPPSNPRVVGWWRAGGLPGAARGTAVIAGHTVHTGGGAFDHLGELRPGDRFRLRTGSGVIHYAVSSVRVFSKASLATHAPRVFSQSVPGRLALVTCDDWNGTTYESNAVVLATPRHR